MMASSNRVDLDPERAPRPKIKQLEVIHALSREEEVERHGPSFRKGRVGEELIRASIPDPSAVVVFTCGPAVGKWDKVAAKKAGKEPRPRFMETVLGALANLGLTRERIHRESYG